MRRAVWHWLIGLGVTYLLLLLLAFVFEKSMVFFPNIPGRLSGDWNPPGLAKEDVWLTTSDGVRLHAWWVPAPGAEFTFIAFHGNAANIAKRADVYAFFRSVPVNFLAVEYRGYGKSEGSPDEQGFYRDAEAGYDYLVRERGISPDRIVSYGQSIGTPVAAHLAMQREVAGVVLEAPFPSARAVARRVYFFLPGLGYVIRSRFETSAYLRRVRKPLLVAQCAEDPVIAPALGQRVFEDAPEPKLFFRARGYCHEEIGLVAPEEYREQLRKFLALLEK